MKLWNKEGITTSAIIESFTVGKDKDFDLRLAKYDVLGTMAHTKMLSEVGLLSKADYAAIETELSSILKMIESNEFLIDLDEEDVHSQIEKMLTEKLGEVGKKIHSGRSRNDQVLTDIKLFLKDELKLLSTEVKVLFNQLIALSEKHKNDLLPGYTHFQMAMPSSFGMWFGAWAESLVDDMELVQAAYNVCDKNPLGSGAGYGSSFPLNRTMTTELLHFSSMNVNPVYAQMTRGKTEKVVSYGISSIASTLSRFSYDVCLYMNQQFGFISFPDELTTGSSLMPHKKNPDVFELIRAKCNRIQAIPNELTILTNNLPSGYHRDMQLTKEILFPALEQMHECLHMMHFMLEHIQIKKEILSDHKFNLLFTVEKVNELVSRGVPFREAYKLVGEEVAKGKFTYSGNLTHTHEGSIGNLCNDRIVAAMDRFKKLTK